MSKAFQIEISSCKFGCKLNVHTMQYMLPI